MSVFVNDGRDHLRMQPEESFDLITGEPPPIAYAGVVNLYTREFFELVRSRLTRQGVVTYWLPVNQVSEAVARSIVRAFLDAFPEAVMLSGFREHLILVGAKTGRPTIDPARVARATAPLPGAAHGPAQHLHGEPRRAGRHLRRDGGDPGGGDARRLRADRTTAR